MAKTHYAWSQIQGGSEEKPVKVARGSKVTASNLGISEQEFEAHILAGAIREKPFPAPDDYQGSAVDYLREQLAEAQLTSALDEAEAVAELAIVEEKSK